jgi:hypothetical protein
MKIISRVINLFRRSQQARKFGIQFTRTADWQLPKQVIINNELKSLNLPDDNGTRVAFLDIFLDDCYGINQRHVSQPVETILDIGSWHLKQTIELSQIFEFAKIHAFEPNPETNQYCNNILYSVLLIIFSKRSIEIPVSLISTKSSEYCLLTFNNNLNIDIGSKCQ